MSAGKLKDHEVDGELKGKRLRAYVLVCVRGGGGGSIFNSALTLEASDPPG